MVTCVGESLVGVVGSYGLKVNEFDEIFANCTFVDGKLAP